MTGSTGGHINVWCLTWSNFRDRCLFPLPEGTPPTFGHIRFLILAAYFFVVLSLIALATPPWQNADEYSHMIRAVEVANGHVIGERRPGGNKYWGISGALSDPSINDANLPLMPIAMHPDRRVTQAALSASNRVTWSNALEFTANQNTVQYGPIFYLPEAACYWVGWLAHLTVNETLRLARGLNALIFSIIAAASLIIARRSRLPLAATLFLPTSLALGAACSQDSLIIACTALTVAIIDRIIAEQRDANLAELWLLSAIIAGTAMARPPYACFLLIFWQTNKKFSTKPLLPALAAAGVVFAWCLLVAEFVSTRTNGGDIHRQLVFLADNPGAIAGTLINTARAYGSDVTEQMVGVIDWCDTQLPISYMTISAAILTLAYIAGTDGATRQPVIPLAGCALAVASIIALQYLTWTQPGDVVVHGILGRYFIPIIMVICLALPESRLQVRASARLALCIQAVATPPILLSTLIDRYYGDTIGMWKILGSH